MCGRFALTLPDQSVRQMFQVRTGPDQKTAPRYNICPTQPVDVCYLDSAGMRAMDRFRWGFSPAWYKTLEDGPLLINARSETIAEKPAFREACRSTRCLIPASGFYEWTAAEGRGKNPWYIHPEGAEAMAMAGIWRVWTGPGGEEIPTVAIVTCEANARLADIHHRMPVLVDEEDYGLWLGEDGKGAARLMRPAADDLLTAYRVARTVNAARHDTPELMEPLGEEDEEERGPLI